MNTHEPPPPRAEMSPGLVRVALTTEHLTWGRERPTGEWLMALADDLGGDRLEVDLSGVRYLTSESLGELVALHRRAGSGGGRLAVTGVTPSLRELFEVTRLDRLLDIHWAACEGGRGRQAS